MRLTGSDVTSRLKYGQQTGKTDGVDCFMDTGTAKSGMGRAAPASPATQADQWEGL